MRRETLTRLVTDRGPMVRALDVESGEERIVDPAEPTAMGRAAAAAIKADASGGALIEGRQWFLTVYNQPWELVIIGAVHIAQALAAMARPAGYDVRIVDPRDVYTTPERFAGLSLVKAWPDEALAEKPLTGRSALIALAHDPKLDDPALAAALRSPAPYIGALGSVRTHVKRLARLEALGFSAAELGRIRGPVGLAIGARSPAEIAIAILAELVQIRRTPAPKVGGVVLAAGQSRRMGRNKLIADAQGKPLLRHAVEAALASRLDPVIVVTGHDAAQTQGALQGLAVTYAHNPAFADGLSTSLRAGIAALPSGCDGAMVLLGDMPDIKPDLIDRTISAFEPKAGRSICVATAQGRRGHPVLWGRQYFAAMDGLEGDAGARALMERYSDQVCEIETDDQAVMDIDTPDALDAWARRR